LVKSKKQLFSEQKNLMLELNKNGLKKRFYVLWIIMDNIKLKLIQVQD